MTADQLFEKLGYTRSTTYRYLKVLVDAGLLTSWHGNGYALGPRIIELSSVIAARDPLILASKPEMRNVCQNVPGLIALCRRFRDRLLCIHAESSVEDIQPRVRIGQSMPLDNCASARVILAQLNSQQLRKFYEKQPKTPLHNGFSASLPDLRQQLRLIREQGFDADIDANTGGQMTIAVAVLDATGMPLGTLSLAISGQVAQNSQVPELAHQLIEATHNITRTISL